MICLDIETVPDHSQYDNECAMIRAPKWWKDPDKIEAHRIRSMEKVAKDMALKDSALIKLVGIKTEGEIICLCDFPAPSLDGIICLQVNGQEEMAKAVSEIFVALPNEEIVTFNGYGFDLPKLRLLMARHNQVIPETFWSGVDLMKRISRLFSTNTNPFISMASAAYKLGIITRPEKVMSGENFGNLLNEEKYVEAVLYNVIDLMITSIIFVKIH